MSADDEIRRRWLLSTMVGVIGGGGGMVANGGRVTARSRGLQDLRDYEWSMYGGGVSHSGSTPIEGITSVSGTGFSFGGESTTTIPAVADGTAYIGGDGQLVATGLVPDATEWVYRGSEPIIGSPGVGDERVVVVTEEGSVVAIDRETGEKEWSSTLRGLPGLPTIHEGLVYVGDNQGTVYALRARSGELAWSKSFDAEQLEGSSTYPAILTRPTVAVGPELHYVNITSAYGSQSKLVALSEQGEISWEHEIETDRMYSPSVIDPGVVVTTADGVRLLSKTGGLERWMEPAEVVNYPAAAGNGYVAVYKDAGVANSRCTVVDSQTGEQQWEYVVDKGPGSGLTITKNVVYFKARVSGEKHVVGVGLEDGLEKFSRQVQAGTHILEFGPVPVPGGLFIPSETTAELLVTDSFPSSDVRSEATTVGTTGSQSGSTGESDTADSSLGDSSEVTSRPDGDSAQGSSTLFDIRLSFIESVVVICSCVGGGLISLYKLISENGE